MKNKDGFESWLLGQGVPESQLSSKVTSAHHCEVAIGKDLDDWSRHDAAALLQVRGGPVGAALRTPGKKGASLFAMYFHSAKLYIGYRVALTPPGDDLERLTGALELLEELCPSTKRWAKAMGAA